MDPLVTVLIPTFDHVRTLELSIPTALAQTHDRLEVIVVGDGAPDATRDIVERIALDDDRVSYLGFPKGERNGERHRHEVLTERATGDVVCYLSDDDLWLDDHVETILARMHATDANFVSCQSVWLRPDDAPAHRGVVDLGREWYRNELIAGRNRVSLSSGAHTMDLYHQLPYGWRTTPAGTPTDLYMWQQLLTSPACRAASTTFTTVIGLPDALRRHMTADERYRELAAWNPVGRPDVVVRFLKAVQASEGGLLPHADLDQQHRAALAVIGTLDASCTDYDALVRALYVELNDLRVQLAQNMAGSDR